MILFELYNVDIFSKVLEYFVIVFIICILYNKIPKLKKGEKEAKQEKEEKEENCMKNNSRDIELDNLISELKFNTSKNTYDIHNLQLENYELRNKLDKIYSNDLNENINYYKNIVLMYERIEYIQNLVLKISNKSAH